MNFQKFGLRKYPKVFLLLIIVLFVAGLVASYYAGKNSRVSNQIPQPIEIKNSIERLAAASSYWSVFTLPYDGTLSIEALIEKGNAVDIKLMKFEQFDNYKLKKEFKHYLEFEAQQTQHYKRSGPLPAGKYVFVMKDKSFGILSAAYSEVQLQINLVP